MHPRSAAAALLGLAALGAALAAASLPLPAQLVRASGTQGWTTHPLLDSPRGVDLRAALPTAGALSLFELGFTRLNSTGEGSAVVCAGLAQPGTCPEERFERRGRLSVATASWSFPALRGGSLTLALTPELGLGRASSAIRGLETGNRLDASKWLYAVGAGAAIRWRPLPVLPVQLQAGFHLQRLSPVSREEVVDGYTPFNDPFTVRRVELGVSVGLPGALR
jgi:hypothetical protein